MNYNNGTYLLTGLQAGTVIGYMGNTGANTTGACFTPCRIYNAFALQCALTRRILFNIFTKIIQIFYSQVN